MMYGGREREGEQNNTNLWERNDARDREITRELGLSEGFSLQQELSKRIKSSGTSSFFVMVGLRGMGVTTFSLLMMSLALRLPYI